MRFSIITIIETSIMGGKHSTARRQRLWPSATELFAREMVGGGAWCGEWAEMGL